jgi:hypothetical protein
MKITHVSVSWSEKVSLREYSNVGHSLSLTAELEPDEHWLTAQKELLHKCQNLVRREIDKALEFDDMPPKYYSGPRFQVMKDRQRRIIIIMPDETNDWPDEFTHAFYGNSRKMRRETALAKVKEFLADNDNFTFIDCSDGDLSLIPKPEENKSKEESIFNLLNKWGSGKEYNE